FSQRLPFRSCPSWQSIRKNMTFSLNKTQKLTAIICLFFGTLLLSACGSTTGGDLLGAGGLGDEATATGPAETEVPVVIPPTQTPIPLPTGHIVFVSDRDGSMNL